MFRRVLLAAALVFSANAIAQTGAPYRVAVIFGSHSSGIDGTAYVHFLLVLEEFERRYGVRLDYWRASWGKEGEFSLCFELTELSPGAQAEFIGGLRVLTKKPANGWTAVEENNGCRTHGPVRQWLRRPR